MSTPTLVNSPPTKRRGALSSKHTAEYLDVTVQTLATWRNRGEGPPYAKLGTKIVYRIDDLDRYLADNLVDRGGDRR